MYKTTFSIFLSVLMVVAFSSASASASCWPSKQDSVALCELEISVGDTILHSISTDTLLLQLKKKKIISALFAFPFPFGCVGAHRVMLGTKPWIPIVYVATFGGCFGFLPLIDFLVILNAKDITQYENNPNLFMWIK